MHQIFSYEVYIFDCDGVILDSNQLKIEAMKNALEAHFSNAELIAKCVAYFRLNFGKSRFHHIAHFLDNIINTDADEKEDLRQKILADFSRQCRALYSSAELTPGFMQFLELCKGKLYVASGSEQGELRSVFAERGLSKHFDGIYGSPTPKVELIQAILNNSKSSNAVMIGDAESDMISAKRNKIDFIFYSPYSNVKEKMMEYCKANKYLIINDFSTVR